VSLCGIKIQVGVKIEVHTHARLVHIEESPEPVTEEPDEIRI